MSGIVPIPGFIANAGDTIVGQVQYANGTYSFWLADYTAGFWTNPTVTSSNWTGASSEFIVERPVETDPLTLQPIYEPLANFGSVYWSQAVTNANAIGIFPNQNVTMTFNGSASGRVLASTSAGLTNNQNFTDTWRSCS